MLDQARSTERYRRQLPADEAALSQAIVRPASQYGRYGWVGRQVNHKRVERTIVGI